MRQTDPISPCASCPQSKLGFCGAILGSDRDHTSTPAWQHHFVVGPNKQVIASNQPSQDVYVLCTGWALRFLQLPDGRRQILNFLLPGDLFSASSLFKDRVHFSVKALTAIQVSGMNRNEVQARISRNPSVLAPAVAISCSAETEASEKMLAAIGLCSAEERIAYLILHLMKRIGERSVIRENRYPLPLRQQDIAEAVGLTPVHVSRILSSFREKGIADLSNGILEVFNLRELQRLASVA
jgi:CRP/FNR family transcriptional regulator